MGIAENQLLVVLDSSTKEWNVQLPSSKSISNRVLIIKALCSGNFEIMGLSNAHDTQLLCYLLSEDRKIYNAEDAGTTFRFLTSFLALTAEDCTLTGSERMKQRPIAPLVEALNSIGANIEYLEEPFYPPLRIRKSDWNSNHVTISADISSQFITSLLLIIPYLPNGLTIELDGKAVSKPYIDMTLKLMQYFGIEVVQHKKSIEIKPQQYVAKPIEIEGDWSSASYFYGICAMSKDLTIRLTKLNKNSIQGDEIISKIMKKLGVVTDIDHHICRITKKENHILPEIVEWDFSDCPDLVMTVSVTCAGLGVSLLMTGIDSLKIKETDRIQALRNELKKLGIHLIEIPQRFANKSGKKYFLQEGKAKWTSETIIETYNDHRIAMSFAMLGILAPISIENPEVVRKSYPTFWENLPFKS